MQAKDIHSAKGRIAQGLNFIENIKSSVTGIDIEKAIELKDSYDKLSQRFQYLKTPLPDNKEFNNLYVKPEKQKPKANPKTLEVVSHAGKQL
jgi:hypothetical protein